MKSSRIAEFRERPTDEPIAHALSWVIQPEPTPMRYVKQEEPAIEPRLLFLMTGLVVVLGAGVLSVVTISLLRLS
jgi:hypothetical protein